MLIHTVALARQRKGTAFNANQCQNFSTLPIQRGGGGILRSCFLGAALLACMALNASATTCFTGTAPNVLTAQYDAQRTGVNANETCLTPSASYTSFQNQGSYSTDGPVYAQPLYVNQILIGGNYKNMLIVATLNDSLYAYDADSLVASVLWTTRNFISDCGALSVIIPGPIATLPKAGILSTPVVDKAAGLIYAVSGCQDSSGRDRWYLHALVLTTGLDATGYPVRISGSVSSSNNADGSSGTCGAYPATGCSLSFNETYQLQRPALLQTRNDVSGVNEVYAGFGISSDLSEKNANNKYHGWLFGYNAGQSSPQTTFATTPTGLASNSYTPACSILSLWITVTGAGTAAEFGNLLQPICPVQVFLLPQAMAATSRADTITGVIPKWHLLSTGHRAPQTPSLLLI